MKLTEKELAVMKAIDASEYGDYLDDEIWTFSLEYNVPKGGPKGKEISGVCSSLKKKGLVRLSNTDDRDTIYMTDEGIKAYTSAVGGKTNKPSKV
jgi:hypothetical protein